MPPHSFHERIEARQPDDLTQRVGGPERHRVAPRPSRNVCSKSTREGVPPTERATARPPGGGESHSWAADVGPAMTLHPDQESLEFTCSAAEAARRDPDSESVSCAFRVGVQVIHLPCPSASRRVDAGRKPLGTAPAMAPWVVKRLSARRRPGLANGERPDRQPPPDRGLGRHGGRCCAAPGVSVDGHSCFGPSRLPGFRSRRQPSCAGHGGAA